MQRCNWKHRRYGDGGGGYGDAQSGVLPKETGVNNLLNWFIFVFSLFISGFYMYVTSLTGISGSEAVLKSPVYQKSSPTCVFEFYYRMTGTFGETLTLYLNSGSRKTAIWTRSGKTLERTV